MGIEFKAVRSVQYREVAYWLGGHDRYEKELTWRVQIKIDQAVFYSNKTYESEQAAKKAAKRMALKQVNRNLTLKIRSKEEC